MVPGAFVGNHLLSFISRLRPIQIWVPVTRREGFAEECRRQCLLVANDPQEADVLSWIDEVSDTEGWK
ncbi:MAG: antitoxin MazE family protein [Desulfohalobiaceae bacterium]|nr:antitoxin MazE family protein [Desulfohalobiaceae bacterium]